LVNTQRFALGAIFVYQLALLHRFEQGLDLWVGLKAFLNAGYSSKVWGSLRTTLELHGILEIGAVCTHCATWASLTFTPSRNH
jgi:hypothetical protein